MALFDLANFSALPKSHQAAKSIGAKFYFTGKPCPHGHVAPRISGKCWCILCRKKTQNSREPARLRYQRARLKNPIRMLLSHARHNAKRKGYEYSLSTVDIVLGNHCPCCGVKFELAGNNHARSAPSLDRFDSSKGYIPGNINVICWACNNMKGAATSAQLRMIADWMERVISIRDALVHAQRCDE